MAENTENAASTSAKRDFFAKVILIGKNVRLEPLSSKHCETLAVAGADPAIWRYTATQHYAPGTMQSFIDTAMAQYAEHKAVPHAFIDVPSNAAVGSARFQYIEPAQRRLLIGGTWIGTAFQRSYINGEAKLLHLWYAFEILGCRRVEFMTDAANAKSRASFVKLGAKEEGILRKHMIHADGRNRDNAVFSIIDDEWPTIKQGLETRLGYKVTPTLTEVAD